MKPLLQQSVLIIDDDKEITNSLVDVFRHRGWHADGAYSGSSGIDLFVQSKRDAVLLDISLPGESGLDLIPKLLDIDSEACIIMLTARDSFDNCLTAFNLGAWDFIRKPVQANDLIDRVNIAMQQFDSHLKGMRVTQLLGFTRAVSHSLKNQLDAFRVLALMIRNESDTQSRVKLWEKLDQHCEDYRVALDRFQRFSRLEDPDYQSYNLTDLLNRVSISSAERFQRLHFGHRASAIIEAQNVQAMGDPILVGEVMDTIFTNAYEASPSDKIVTVNLSIDGNLATITVEDEGEGFKRNILERIGKAWVSTRGGQGNYGIGLLMGAKVARYYRGYLKACNRTDRRGAKVTFSIQIHNE